MNIAELKAIYTSLLRPVFGRDFRIDDSDEAENWIAIMLDGEKEDFFFSLYGVDCVRLFWCNECFIFDKMRNSLVSSDTCGEIVYEEDFEVEELPMLIFHLILALKDRFFVEKEEKIKGKTLFGYDNIKDYVIIARGKSPAEAEYKLGNITIKYIL